MQHARQLKNVPPVYEVCSKVVQYRLEEAPLKLNILKLLGCEQPALQIMVRQ